MGLHVFFKWHRRALLTISAAPHLMCKFYVNQMLKEDLTRATRTSVLLCLGCSQVCLNSDLDSLNWNHRWDDKLLPPLCWVWFVLSRSTKCSWKQGAKVSPTNFRRLTACYNNPVSWLKLGRGIIRFSWLQCHYQVCLSIRYFIGWFDFLWGERVDLYRFSTPATQILESLNTTDKRSVVVWPLQERVLQNKSFWIMPSRFRLKCNALLWML